MKEPRPMLRGALPELHRRVLRSADDDAPSPRARTGTLAAMGLASAATAATSSAAAGATAKAVGTASTVAGTAASTSAGIAAKTSVAVGAPVLLKWIAIGVATISAVSIGAVEYQNTRTQPPVSKPAPAPSARPKEPVMAVATAAAPPIKGVETPDVRTPPPPSPAPVVSVRGPDQDDPIARDLATLDGAHAAVNAGDPRRALVLLSQRGGAVMRGPLAPEARVVRIEALAAARDTAQARDEARAFLADSPQSPQARHVRSILAGLEEKP